MIALRRLPGRLLIAAVLVAAALVPVFGGAYLTTFLFTLLYAYIVAQSWDWLHGEAGYVNLGHYIYFGVGAYAFAIANVNGVPVVAFLPGRRPGHRRDGRAAELPAVPAARRLFCLRDALVAAAVRAAGLEPRPDHARLDGILLPPATAMVYGIDVKMFAYYVALADRWRCSA